MPTPSTPDAGDPSSPTKWTPEQKARLIRQAAEHIRLNRAYLAERGILDLQPRTRDEEILSRLD